MAEKKHNFHGSDVEKVEEIYGIPKKNIISFSGNVNPLGISPKLKLELSERVDEITTYPDRNYNDLREAIGKYTNTNKDKVVVGNGATELISLLIKINDPQNALIIAPTYSEYEREIAMNGGRASYHELNENNNFKLDLALLSDDLAKDIDMLIICNPNNPTSTSISKDDMDNILSICKTKNIFVMVDETYVEFAENMEEITSVSLIDKYDNLIVLRGVSKFYSSPGLRLGYALGDKTLIENINKIKNPWSLNSLGSIAGEIMFNDSEYIEKTKNLIHNERERITKILDSHENIKYYKPTANFVLVRILKEGITSGDIFESAIKQGYMIRDCSTFKFLDDKYFRFAFMQPEQNTALLKLISELL